MAPIGAQVNVDDSIAVVGVKLTLEITGTLFVTVAVSVAVPVPPSTSVAVAVQVIMSPDEAIEAKIVTTLLLPMFFDPFVQI